MTVAAARPPETPPARAGASALAAARGRLGIVALLVALAAAAWWSTADRMGGMDAGPGTELGALGRYVGVWVVMMAAMMLPSVAPTVALYARMTRARGAGLPLLFTAGYLVTWALAGVAAYAVFRGGRAVAGEPLAWDAGGRWLAAAILVLAAAYELTPAKDACLARCRTPLGFLLTTWRGGRRGAVEMGARHGAWCVGCCWALMAGLFALGMMSVAWAALVAALIALEKTLPWRRTATGAAAAMLLLLALGVAAKPGAVPGLTVPGAGGATDTTMSMPMR